MTTEHERQQLAALRQVSAHATAVFQRSCSEVALTTAVELMLTDHTSAEVVAHLRQLADYLEERT